MTRSALIVAHGQPSDPAPAEADLAQLCASVRALMPDWQVQSATLAMPGALEQALDRLDAPLIFPFFMAGGWFTRTELPRRLAAGGAAGSRILPAFGLMAAVTDLAVAAVRTAILGRGWQIGETVLVLAAHGSGRSPAPAKAADLIKAAIAKALALREIRLGFIEEEPSLQIAATDAGAQTLCLPLFVANWGHVRMDVPASLQAAAFRGPCLAPLGARPEVPALIARAIDVGF